MTTFFHPVAPRVWEGLDRLPGLPWLQQAILAPPDDRHGAERAVVSSWTDPSARSCTRSLKVGVAAIVRRDTSKGSLSIKLKRAGWDDDFLRKVLDGLAEP